MKLQFAEFYSVVAEEWTDAQRRWFFANLDKESGKVRKEKDFSNSQVRESHATELSKRQMKNLSPAHQMALHQYTHQGAIWMNSELRGNKGDVGKINNELKPWVATMDQAFDKSKLGESLVTYRGARNLTTEFKPGTTWEDHGFMSTSMSRDTAEGIGTGNDYDPNKTKLTLFRVHLSPEDRAISLNSIASSKYEGVYGKQDEVLLDRGQKYKVFKVSDTTLKNGKTAQLIDIRPISKKTNLKEFIEAKNDIRSPF